MRKLLGLVVLLLLSSPCWATYARVDRGTGTAQATASSCAVTLTSSAANDLYVIGAEAFDNTETISSVTVSSNSNATAYVGPISNSTHNTEWLYYAIPTTSSGFTFTVNFSSSVFHSCVVVEFSGNPTSGITDHNATGTGNGSSLTAGSSITPTQANSLVVVLGGSDAATTMSAGTNFTLNAHDTLSTGGIGIEYWIQTTATATNGPMSLSGSNNWIDIVADFNISGITPSQPWVILP